MIISHKHKYIFIGLPFSGSSTISRELIEHYEGEYILNKHSNIQHLLKSTYHINIDIKEYFVFAVYRDPVDICYSIYTKFKTNAKEVYTNKKYLIENGGHISHKKVRLYERVQKEKLTFSGFLEVYLKGIPYDNVFSINEKHLDKTIDFNHLDEDFQKVLTLIGLESRRSLPVYNKTSHKDKSPAISEHILFQPYYLRRASIIKRVTPKVFFYRVFYHLIHPVRKFKWLKQDFNRSDARDEYFGESKGSNTF